VVLLQEFGTLSPRRAMAAARAGTAEPVRPAELARATG
jgi:hypothetical protein